MKVDIQDADALKRITPNALRNYVDDKFWVKTGTYGEYSDVYQCDFDPTEIVIPRTDIIADYARCVKRLVETFAKIEDVDQMTMYNTLLNYDDTTSPTLEEIAASLSDGMKISYVGNGDWVIIRTEFMDRHNDHIVIYARYDTDNSHWEVSDDGYVLSDLYMSGIKDSIPEKTLERVFRDYCITHTDNELKVYPDKAEFRYRVYNLLQAMIILLNWQPKERAKEPSQWLGL